MPNSNNDLFFGAYDRDEIAYGMKPSAALAACLEQFAAQNADRNGGRALDLGAGPGRDTLAMARAGFHVKAVDLSKRGLERLVERAESMGLADRVEVQVADVRQWEMEPNTYDLICGTTVLDHLPAADSRPVFYRMAQSLSQRGVLFVEVHTTEDPGSDQPPGCDQDLPVSETAGAVIHYFSPNQLAHWAADPQGKLRILHYEERIEWDYTHGPEHAHGKAILLAVRAGHYPQWFGITNAFPRSLPK